MLRTPMKRSISPSAIRRSSIDSRPPAKGGSARSKPRNRLDRRPLASRWGIRRAESVLSRQDWRGAGWGNRADGECLLQVSRPGSCRITVRPCIEKVWPPAESVSLRLDEERLDFNGQPAGTEWVFPLVKRKPEPLHLETAPCDPTGVIGAGQLMIEGSLGR